MPQHEGVSATRTSSAARSQVCVRVLDRPRLSRRLDTVVDPGSGVRLVTVCAPTGFGKTTLLEAWVRSGSVAARPVVWCAFDESDSSGLRMWDPLLEAMSAASGQLAATTPSAPSRAGDLVFLGRVVQALAGARAVLVLDNLHEVTDQRTLRDLDYVLRRVPADVAVFLSSRTEPALPSVQRAKLTGGLDQVRAADLAFTLAETEVVCRPLTPDQTRAVWTSTEGWPALVQVRVRALSSPGSAGDPVTAVPGAASEDSDMELGDYLFEETFQRQPDPVQKLLLVCSVPESFTFELAAQLSGRRDAGHLLLRVARLSGLVTRAAAGELSTPSYRLHPMLRAYLRGELRRQGGDTEKAAHRSAAQWCRDHDLDLLAVQHAGSSEDADFHGEIVGALGPGLVAAGLGDALLDALGQGRPRECSRNPWIPMVRAMALADAGRVDEALRQVSALKMSGSRAVAPEGEPGSALDLAAAREIVRLQVDRLRGHHGDPDELADEPPGVSADLALLLHAERGFRSLRTGELDAATAQLERAVELARIRERIPVLVSALANLSGVEAVQWDLPRMMASAEEAATLAEAHAMTTDRRMAIPQALLGWGSFQRLDDDAARRHLATAQELRDADTDPTRNLLIRTLSAIVNGRPPSKTGTEGAQLVRLLDGIWHDIDGHLVAPSLVAYLAVNEARTHIMLQRVHEVPAIVDAARQQLGPCAEIDLVTAMVREATGRRAEARAMLSAVIEGEHPTLIRLTQVDAYALSAALACLDDDHPTAGKHARAALQLADELGGLRPLVDAGQAFHEVLRRGRGHWGTHEGLVERVLQRSVQPSLPTVSLTSRELEILRELPSMSTAEEIAATLFVSINTVKTHLRSIYRKLGVDSRRSAVLEARRVGLL